MLLTVCCQAKNDDGEESLDGSQRKHDKAVVEEAHDCCLFAECRGLATRSMEKSVDGSINQLLPRREVEFFDSRVRRMKSTAEFASEWKVRSAENATTRQRERREEILSPNASDFHRS
jgi:hypothetical protein